MSDNREGTQMIAHRAEDKENLKPTRVLPTATAITIATPFLLLGIGAAYSQIEQNARRTQHDLAVVEKLGDLRSDFRALAARVDAKGELDSKQSADIYILQQRILQIDNHLRIKGLP